MKLSIVIVTLSAVVLSSGEAQFNNYPTPIYQQGSQFNLPGQPIYNYQPGVPTNVQQLPQSVVQQPGQVPLNYPPNVPGVPINIQQLTQTGSTQPIQPTNNPGFPIGNQQVFQPQTVPFGVQQNGIPINALQQGGYPVNQQFVPQIGNVGAPGPITFPR
ncbi:calcium-binding protein P-like [Bradysia coprophila]|uniref:calcium-binding protein P-like n=1 Tax=Bradysia coprophila TaxID=38358 RepID=UPI00187DA2F8|nr:calcium-binding protein P-like [Bradysia coprophila]